LFFHFRLFVTGENSRSRGAIHQAQNLCSQLPEGRWHLDVYDVTRNAEQAEKDGILATPTLLCISPYSQFRLVGGYNPSDVLFRFLPIAQKTV
jgi:circadian clock protein KaiB